jgi:hypothetical protein
MMDFIIDRGLLFLALSLIVLDLNCCFHAAGQPFPTSQQMMAACDLELKAGKPSAQAPDCVAHWVAQQACNAQAFADVLNPIVIPAASAGNPLLGSLLNDGAIINTAICRAQGFYN